MLYPGFSKKANINFGRSYQVKMARNRKYQILVISTLYLQFIFPKIYSTIFLLYMYVDTSVNFFVSQSKDLKILSQKIKVTKWSQSLDILNFVNPVKFSK